MSEPGCGRRIDACPRVLRTGPVARDTADRLGSVAGEVWDGSLQGQLEAFATPGSRSVLLAGFDPKPVESLLLRGFDSGAFELAGAMCRALGVGVPDCGLDPGYVINPVAYFDDTLNTDEWQREVYDYARRLAAENGYTRILDIGCGGGYKLVHGFPEPEFRTIGLDLPKTVEFLRGRYPERTWLAVDIETEDMLCFRADLVIVSDIIEHLEDPTHLLKFLGRCDAKAILLSTPDAESLVARGERTPLGPPTNEHHVREWTFDQFSRFVSGSLQLVSRTLYPKNATQLLVCQTPGQRPKALDRRSVRPVSRVTEPVVRVRAPFSARKGGVAGGIDTGARGYVQQSRTRALEACLLQSDSDLVSLVLGSGAFDPELLGSLERAVIEGAELGLVPASGPETGDWSALDGVEIVVCDRRSLLTALALERGPHGVERAVFRLAERTPKKGVAASRNPQDPAEVLARIDALVTGGSVEPAWSDARLVLGPSVRAASEAARSSGRLALAADLTGYWAAQCGQSGPLPLRSVIARMAEAEPTNPELEIPVDRDSRWTLLDLDDDASSDRLLEYARVLGRASAINLVSAWASGYTTKGCVRRVLEILTRAGLDPERVAPLVILERPLWHAELSWIATQIPAAEHAGREPRLAGGILCG